MAFARERWGLPGPARYARSVRASLERGFSTCCVVPAHLLADADWADGLNAAADIAVDVIIDQPDRPPSVVLHEYMQLGATRTPAVAGDLASDERLHGRIFQVELAESGRRQMEWVRFLTQFIAGVRTVGVGDRPRVVIICSHPVADSFTESNLLLDHHWWWGVLGRVDTTIHVSQALADRPGDALTAESIVEVVGYDLDAGQSLADSWDGTLEGLPTHLPAEQPVTAVSGEALRYGTSVDVGTPPHGCRAAWDAGAIERWDRYHAFLSPRFLHERAREDVLQTRIWRAQLREFMPMIDEERQRLERWIKTIPLEREPDYPLEIGPLSHLIKYDSKARLHVSRSRRDAAEWLRKARNLLAHRTILRPEFILDGRRLLDADRRQADAEQA